jgi:NADPH:quinone reductase-like Zn-dependent oxidoreductase
LKPKPGFMRLFMGVRRPRNPEIGIDAAGVVEKVGPDARRFKPGDQVMTDLFAAGRFGAFAEYVCAAEKAFEPIPAGMSFEEAATLPHSAVLALQAMRLRGGRTFERGASVLIDGASGNVGPFAVQIAKAMGAEVTGVGSGEKLDFVRSVGADHVIDYRTIDYTRAPERYDWIVAVDAHHSIRAARRALKPGGVYITLPRAVRRSHRDHRHHAAGSRERSRVPHRRHAAPQLSAEAPHPAREDGARHHRRRLDRRAAEAGARVS